MSQHDPEITPEDEDGFDEPTEYTAEQPERADGLQDVFVDPAYAPRGLLLGSTDHFSPRDYTEALAFARGQAASPTQDWTALCQSFVRSCYDIPPLFGSAFAQWLGADPEDRHEGGDPADAPLGSGLCFKGASVNGHIELAARPFKKSGTAAGWSNDLVTTGRINKVARTAATSHWGQTYLGYVTAINGYDLQLKKAKPPKPKQNKRYEGVSHAIDRLEAAAEAAKKQRDHHDVQTLTGEIHRLKHLYETLRRY